MKRWIVTVTCIALAGCGGSRGAQSSEASAGGTGYGLYSFSASAPNQLIHGTIRVGPEGTDIQSETACQLEATASTTRYYCGGTMLTFDRRNPRTAKYAMVRVLRRREICTHYETRNARQVCVKKSAERYYVTEQRTGGVRVRRIS
jgi:hypothetical protein